jgi:predicted TIM-barrel fold metal-dependent hydrolase
MARTYLDTAASPFLYSPQIFDVACRIMGPDKILFGSDFPLLTLDRYVKDLERARVSAAVREAILGGNAARLIDKKCCYADAR